MLLLTYCNSPQHGLNLTSLTLRKCYLQPLVVKTGKNSPIFALEQMSNVFVGRDYPTLTSLPNKQIFLQLCCEDWRKVFRM